MVELEESQWWVLETANTPGNEPAKVIYLLEIDPINEEISLLIGSLAPHVISDNVTVKYKRLERLHVLLDNFVLLRLYLDLCCGFVYPPENAVNFATVPRFPKSSIKSIVYRLFWRFAYFNRQHNNSTPSAPPRKGQLIKYPLYKLSNQAIKSPSFS